MAKNSHTGSVIAPLYFGPGLDQAPGNILSGNLSTSDGAEVINVPRVSNAGDNRIVTNVDNDSNTFTCESNLTFDGTALGVTGEITSSTGVSASYLMTDRIEAYGATVYVGDLTASAGISGSYFMGDGSRLTGITATGGSGGGIFTEINATQANTTSSILVGASATPAATVHVVGSSFMSGALIHKRTFVTSNYSVTTTDYYIGVDTTSNTVKLTLPVATSMLDGQTIIVKDEGGNALANNITISGSAADTIDGQNQVVLESPHASIQLYCNGITKYFIV